MKGALVGIFKTHSFLRSTSSIKFRGHVIFSIISLRILGILDGSRQHEDIGGQYKLKTGKVFQDLNLNLTKMME